MTFAQFLFVAIDKLFDGAQNNKRMLRFKDVKFDIETDIAYGTDDAEKLDTYVVKKDSDEKYPVFFYIHGGGFVAGDKHYRRGLARWAANKGFFVVNVNYGLGPKDLFPKGIQHLVHALNWVGENAEKYKLDLDNMCVSGDSAGGYYSAMLACVSTNKALQERFGVETNLRFRTAMLDCGIYDVGEALGQKMPFNLTDKVLVDFSGIHVKDLDMSWLRLILWTQHSRSASSPMQRKICSAKDKDKSSSPSSKTWACMLKSITAPHSWTTTAIRSIGPRARQKKTSAFATISLQEWSKKKSDLKKRIAIPLHFIVYIVSLS